MKAWMIVGILLIVGIVILFLIGPALLKNLQTGIRIAVIILILVAVCAALYYIYRESGIGPGSNPMASDSTKNEEMSEMPGNAGEAGDGDTILIRVNLDDISILGQSFEEPEDAARVVAELTLTSDKPVILVDDFATAKTYLKMKTALEGKGIPFSEKEL